MIELVKYRGFGSEYIIYDPNKYQLELTPERIKKISYINCGGYVDGIIYGPIITENKMEFIIFNIDGTKAKLNANAARIFIKYLLDTGYEVEEEITLLCLNREIDIVKLEDYMDGLKLSIRRTKVSRSEVMSMDNSQDSIPDTIYMAGPVKQVGSIYYYN
ncbi:hypothetical protein [Anaeromicropila herbilytica]|nr:hypothetical protein [Anaeromicropila herbilytica]